MFLLTCFYFDRTVRYLQLSRDFRGASERTSASAVWVFSLSARSVENGAHTHVHAARDRFFVWPTRLKSQSARVNVVEIGRSCTCWI